MLTLTILFKKILTKKCVLCRFGQSFGDRTTKTHTHAPAAHGTSASYILSFLGYSRLPPDNQNYCSFSVSAARRFSRYGSKIEIIYLSYIIRIILLPCWRSIELDTYIHIGFFFASVPKVMVGLLFSNGE